MRVIHLLWQGEIGGAERAVYQLASCQRRAGMEVALGFGQATGRYCEVARSQGLDVVDFALRAGLDLAGLRRAARELHRFDVHHFHGAEPVLMLASIFCPRACRLYTHRGGISRYKGKQGLRYRLLAPLVRRYFAAVTGTAHAAQAVEQLFGIPAEAVFLTTNAVDPAFLRSDGSSPAIRRSQGLGSSTVLIGTAANLRAWKRIDWLLHAASRLRPGNWKVVVLGDGNDRERLQAIASRSPCAENIIFAGMQPDVEEWLQAFDVFVLPSGGEESFGNAVVEAMACGLPVIVCADCPAHLEHVVDGATGLVVPDQEAMVCRLQELVDEPELRARLGKAARGAVGERYSVESMLSRYDDLYRTLLPGWRGSGRLPD